jgi:Tfp pilus assembly protein PilX
MYIMTRNKTTSHAISRVSFNPPSGLPVRQSGAVLLIALVVLIAMTLSALGLIRSVNTTNLIAGNLAFRESAVLSAERSMEIALNNCLLPNSVKNNVTLYNDVYGNAAPCKGYRAVRADPATGENWDTFWENALAAQSASEVEDVAGNTVHYVIHRLCDRVGAPHLANCSKPPSDYSGNTQNAGESPPGANTQIYYRITSQVRGPRNTVAYTQTIVAI